MKGLVTCCSITNCPETQQLKTTNMYYLTPFLKVKNLGAAQVGGSGSGSQEVSVKLLTTDAVPLHGCLQEALFLAMWTFHQGCRSVLVTGQLAFPRASYQERAKSCSAFYDLVQGLANFSLKGQTGNSLVLQALQSLYGMQTLLTSVALQKQPRPVHKQMGMVRASTTLFIKIGSQPMDHSLPSPGLVFKPGYPHSPFIHQRRVIRSSPHSRGEESGSAS